MIAIDPSAFVSPEEFRARVREYVAKSSKKAPGVSEIMIPGEPEQRTRERRLRDGIPIADEVWAEIEQIGKELNVDLKG